MMDALFFVGLILVIVIIANMMQRAESSYKDSIKMVVKQCPPHQWFWQDIVDQNGNKISERMMCKRCGPLRNPGDDV